MDPLSPVAPAALPTQRRVDLLADAARRAAAYLIGQDTRGVTPTPEAVERLGRLRRPFPETGASPEEVLAELDAVGSPATMVTTRGRYFGFVNGGTDPAAHAASVLAGAWDQNVALPVMSPIGTVLDDVAASWVVEALGLPDGAVASFCAGATVANVTCVLVARDALLARAGWDVGARGLWGAPRLRVIVGDEIHISALRALRLAGFGVDGIERVPTDALGRIRADAFPTQTDEKTLVMLQAGNVNTGHSDPFAAIVPRVRERGGWVHVDGAFGLWAAASPAQRGLVEGVERADSWAADGHKWLNTPYDSGIAIARERIDLLRAMHMTAAYVASMEERQPMQLGIQMSQKARGVETWAMLASHGRVGLAALIDRCCDHAAQMASRLAEGGAELLAPVALNQVLVAFGDDAATDAVIARVQADGTCWVGGTTWHGRRAMRISVSDAATTQEDIEASARAILACFRHG